MIKVKYENSWYGYQGFDGYALYVNNKKMHKGLFISIAALRQYWNDYRLMLIADIIPFQYQ